MRILIIIGLFITVSFQACGKTSFSSTGAADASNASLANDGSGTGSVLASGPIVCDPFTNGGSCNASSVVIAGPGLIGNIYYLPNGSAVDQYINTGEKLPLTLILSQLNIPDRAWTDGFPDGNGGLLLDPTGAVLDQYFALDLNGYFELPDAMAEGNYQFATNSDDGSILYLDGNQVVNNDNNHSQMFMCASTTVALTHGVKHAIHLKYYQGPPTEIALQVFLRPASQMSSSCDANGNFTVIPAGGLSH